MKLAIITSTRPELIRLSKIINEARKYYDVTHIYTNQNFDASLSTQFFEEFNIEPDYIFSHDNLSGVKFIGKCFQSLEDILKFDFDAVLVLGDTNGAFTATSVAKCLGIPVFHLEAGNRCYDPERVPEEVNRYQIDSIADWHLCYTQRAREQLLLEGKRPDRCIVIGNPIYEVMKNSVKFHDNIVEPYYLVTIHRKENLDKERLYEILNELDHLNHKVVMSLHPSLFANLDDVCFDETTKAETPFLFGTEFKNIKMFAPTNFNDFVNLEANAKAVITDSGTAIEECMILQTPCVSLRYSTERPELLETNSMVVCSEPEDLKTAVNVAINTPSSSTDSDYHNDVSGNVIKILMRYNQK